MKAIVIESPGHAVLTDRPKPKLRDDYLLVKTMAVAVNPTDWKHIDKLATPGALVGCDYAGVVEEIGKSVNKPFKKGDRVCGFTHGGNKVQPEDGSFAEYIAVKGDIAMRIPDSLSFEKAATCGVSSVTIGQGLYQQMKLERPSNPSEEKKPILIYGGSGGMGTFGIQFAKLSGYIPITTCSPRNFDMVKSLGAAEAFDYNDPDCAKKIRDYTNNELKLCWDTISLPATAKICADALSSNGEGCIYGAILYTPSPREDVKSTYSLGYTAVGEYFEFGNGPSMKVFQASTEDYDFAKSWTAEWEQLLAEGKLKVSEPKVGKGLNEVLNGIDDLRHERVSGTRLVYTIAETP